MGYPDLEYNNINSYDKKNLKTINILDLNFFELNNIMILYFDKKTIDSIVRDFTKFVEDFQNGIINEVFHINNKYIV